MHNIKHEIGIVKITTTEITKTINKLKTGTCKGIDGLQSEHYNFASRRLRFTYPLF